jgi:hypothetical protein
MNEPSSSSDLVPTAPPVEAHHHHPQSFWLWVMCLTGVDYFSTLGYQPSIAFQSAGMLAPIATIVLVLVTLFGALPVYAYVAKSSPEGQGSIGMLARLVSGWSGKILVLTLLGFAATDFVITKTLSAADAAVHLIDNPHWPFAYEAPSIEGLDEAAAQQSQQVSTIEKNRTETRQRFVVTSLLLIMLGAMFMRGFKEVIGLAVGIVALFLFLNLVLVGSSLIYLLDHPSLIDGWFQRLNSGEWFIPEEARYISGSGWLSIIALSILIFPKLALGLSGFETGVAVMPLVKGSDTDTPNNPHGRIANTKKLLITAAVIMSGFLLTSSIIVCTMIEPGDFRNAEKTKDLNSNPIIPGKQYANDRALAFLAHGDGEHKVMLAGEAFGTLYDLSTVVILWFAGASAMAGLLNLVPKYLPRYGMAPEWAQAVRPLVLLFTAINLFVTFIFDADVEAQGGAYATGVLVLILSASLATVIEKGRAREGTWWERLPKGYFLILLVFLYTTVTNVIEKPEGIKIASCFIAAILATSFISRIMRTGELRFERFDIPDPESRLFWDTIRTLEMTVLVPHRPGRRGLAEKEASIRKEHRLPRDLMIVFVEVELGDTSEFIQTPKMAIRQEEGRYIIKVTSAVSIAHTLAALALEMAQSGEPPEIHFGWTDETPLSGTLGFLFFGEGNVPWEVRELIRKAMPDTEKRPRIVVAGP